MLIAQKDVLSTYCLLQLLDLQENHPESYVVFIRPTFDLAVRYNFTDEAQGKGESLKVRVFGRGGGEGGQGEGVWVRVLQYLISSVGG